MYDVSLVQSFPEGLDRVLHRLAELKDESSVKFVSVAGASCSGKSKLVSEIIKTFSGATVLPMDAYFNDGDENTNFDHPESLDLNLIYTHIQELKQERSIHLPIYNFEKNLREEGYTILNPNRIIILEGLFALQSSFREQSSFNIFLDVQPDVALERRIKRDTKERGRTEKSVIKQFYSTVLPMYEQFVLPQKKYADLVIVNNHNDYKLQ